VPITAAATLPHKPNWDAVAFMQPEYGIHAKPFICMGDGILAVTPE
jgi:hypothetical protein